MSDLCFQCGKTFPDAKKHDYFFCPYCGAKIKEEIKRRTDVFKTIPPDLTIDVLKEEEDASEPDVNDTVPHQSYMKTLPPKLSIRRSSPMMKPPKGPPPLSYYRESQSGSETNPSGEKKAIKEKEK